MSYEIRVKIRFEYGHRLINHGGKCRHVHGHSGVATFVFVSETLNQNDFVADFTDVKSPLKAWINERFEHVYLCNSEDPLLPSIKELGLKTYIFNSDPTAEVIAEKLYHVANEIAPAKCIAVEFQETETGFAVFREI